MSKGFFNLDNWDNMSESAQLEMNLLDMPVNENVSVPGGLSETPSSKPYDASSISIPSGTTITANQYNDALAALQKSFKEGYEVMEMLMKANVIQETAEDKQAQFTENAISAAILESFENGPMFEAVKRADKHDVKELVSSLRSKVERALDDENVFFRVPHVWAELIVGAIGAGLGITAATLVRGITTAWSTRLWQILGICHVEKGNVEDLMKKLNEQFEDELGEYKILRADVIPGLYDLFKLKFGWKNRKQAFLLLIDKKLPSDIKSLQEDLVKDIEDKKKAVIADAENKENKKSKTFKEGKDNSDCDCGDEECPECKGKKKKSKDDDDKDEKDTKKKKDKEEDDE